jgi:large subunit ribosomal protein L15
MKIHELKPAPGSRHPRKRVGRGISSGQGKTSGRGQKGQGSRSSVNIPRSFEGGQMPLAQRLPKLRGFTNINRKEFAVVNLGKLNRFEAGTEVNPQLLREAGLVRKPLAGIKILAAGELKVALKVSAHRVSGGARRAIEAVGGSVELLGPQPEDKPAKKVSKSRLAKAAAKARSGSDAPAKGEAKGKPAKGEGKGKPAKGAAPEPDQLAEAETGTAAEAEATATEPPAEAAAATEPASDGKDSAESDAPKGE